MATVAQIRAQRRAERLAGLHAGLQALLDRPAERRYGFRQPGQREATCLRAPAVSASGGLQIGSSLLLPMSPLQFSIVFVPGHHGIGTRNVHHGWRNATGWRH
jgi:hypothetical protein